MRSLLVIAALTAFSLSGCGFSPVYGTGPNGQNSATTQEQLSQIQIGNIPDREGQYLRNALIDRFYTQGRPASPAYALEFTPLQESLINLDTTIFADATRGQLRTSTTFTLKQKDSEEVLLTRNLNAITSYNILASEFSSRVSADNARLNALDDLARQIETQLALYFQR